MKKFIKEVLTSSFNFEITLLMITHILMHHMNEGAMKMLIDLYEDS